MQPNQDGYMQCYYGTFHVNEKKPKQGLIYFMFEEYVKHTIDQERTKLFHDLCKSLEHFRKEQKVLVSQLHQESKMTKEVMFELRQFLGKTIELNKLQIPEEKKKEVKKKRSNSY